MVTLVPIWEIKHYMAAWTYKISLPMLKNILLITVLSQIVFQYKQVEENCYMVMLNGHVREGVFLLGGWAGASEGRVLGKFFYKLGRA